MIRRAVLMTSCVLALGLPLAACQTAAELGLMADGFVSDIFKREDVNLNEKSYAAADYLEQQIKEFVPKSASVSTEPLTLVRESNVSSELGHRVPEQVAERLRQLGYNIKPPGWAEQGEFVLGGTYDRDREHATVNLVMRNAKSGKTAGSFTYMMPITSEVKRLAEPKPRIFKVSQ